LTLAQILVVVVVVAVRETSPQPVSCLMLVMTVADSTRGLFSWSTNWADREALL